MILISVETLLNAQILQKHISEPFKFYSVMLWICLLLFVSELFHKNIWNEHKITLPCYVSKLNSKIYWKICYFSTFVFFFYGQNMWSHVPKSPLHQTGTML